jgi:hypothetical protein
MMDDVLVIIYYDDENGIRHYRCSGAGYRYRKLYSEWFPTSSYRCTDEDFPWDYFVFDDSNDYDRLVHDFPACVSEDV